LGLRTGEEGMEILLRGGNGRGKGRRERKEKGKGERRKRGGEVKGTQIFYQHDASGSRQLQYDRLSQQQLSFLTSSCYKF